jgi:hypothetical protein
MNLPDLAPLNPDELIALRVAVDERLDEIRARIKQQAEAIDKAINGGRPKKKARQHRNDENP